MLKLTILSTGLISFLFFAFPQNFNLKPMAGDVLGVNKVEQVINRQTVTTAINIYCINNGTLPENLNKLFENELSKDKFLDLDKIYFMKKNKDCDFKLVLKSED